jgi:hypothetical protein
VGGGILGGLVRDLAKEGLATPIGSVPSIGNIGWGSPLFENTMKLGVDQIVVAKIDNAQGSVMEAE